MRRRLATFALCLIANLDTVPVSFSMARAAVAPPPAAVVRRRPVPEYEATEAVVLSADLFGAGYHATELTKAILAAKAEVWIAAQTQAQGKEVESQLRSAGLPAKHGPRVRSLVLPHGNIWLRDFGPLPLLEPRSGGGQRLRLADLRYEDPATPTSDALPQALGRKLGLATLPLSAALDGGNFLAGDRICLTTNADLPLSKDAFSERHALQLGCPRLVTLSQSPHAHVDMWVKIVGPHRAFVNELDGETLAIAEELYGHVPRELLELRDALNGQAQELKRHMEVVRIPMPLPHRHVFRTYANALLVNGTAIVPSYEKFGWGYGDYPDARLRASREAKVQSLYEAAGYKVRLINADGMIYNGGAFHCVSLHLPRTGSKSKKSKGF